VVIKLDEKIEIVEVPYLKKKKEKQEACEHNGGSHVSYFTHQEIERKGRYCNNCNFLLDYWPQHSEDDL